MAIDSILLHIDHEKLHYQAFKEMLRIKSDIVIDFLSEKFPKVSPFTRKLLERIQSLRMLLPSTPSSIG